ncbi:MAG: lytic transglycosylase domain-containing protein [Desulfobulbaceae bacterium]
MTNLLTDTMRLLTILAILICLSIITGCAAPKKRSWSSLEDSSYALAKKEKSQKRVWVKTGGPIKVSARPPRPEKIIRFGAKSEIQIAEQEPAERTDLSSGTTESEIVLKQELTALTSTDNWDDHQTGVIQEVEIEDLAENEVVYDFPITVNRQVEVYLELFQGSQRKYFSEWLARSGRYIPMIEAELEAAGLPLDLAYLSMIESGFSQTATSKAKAVGLWQFMSPTGRDYGLEITKYIDERRDDKKSTRAAVAFLSDLYEEFGDWFLAVAAYNGGPGRLRNAIKKSKSKDFWKIAQADILPLETKRYVPKLIAAIIIAKEPEVYGFIDIEDNQPVSYDTIAVGPGLSFDTVARITNSSNRIIQSLNQELLQEKTPLDREKYTLRIPKGTKKMAEKNLSGLYGTLRSEESILLADSQKYKTAKNATLQN